jgi:hypothetical protein
MASVPLAILLTSRAFIRRATVPTLSTMSDA